MLGEHVLYIFQRNRNQKRGLRGFVNQRIFKHAVGQLLDVFCFLRKKVQDIGILKDHILQMSGGDLNHPIASMGNDELGVLARELDQMRSTLYTNIQQEVESRRANQDLITAMSHDLRTPLTILHGYLDILALGRNPEQQSEYVRRCLQKQKWQ